MKSVRIIISGHVQGVGFRKFIRASAKKRNITGWVKNREDKAVEAFLCGDEKKIDELIAICREGPEIALVDRVHVITQDLPENSSNEFLILRNT